MASELRGEHHRDLDRLDISLGALLSVVPEAVTNATRALLSADVGVRAELDRWRSMVSSISSDVDHTAEVVIARQAPVAGELRFLMTCVRLVVHLSDTIDLVADVAGSAVCAWTGSLPDRQARLLVATGDAAAGTWRTVAEMWHERDRADIAALRAGVDRLAEARASLAAGLVLGGLEPVAVVDLAGGSSCYERIGRHAVAAGSLIASLVPPSDQ